nr:MAG TPA_asm: hypothetical protein [Caudoviricetes sp.]
MAVLGRAATFQPMRQAKEKKESAGLDVLRIGCVEKER